MSNVAKTTSKKKAKTKKGNGATAKATPAATPGPEVVHLSDDDGQTVRSAHKAIADGQAALGAIRENYLANEAAQMQAISKSRQDFESVMRTLAEKHGVDLANGQWIFNLADMTFTPRQG